MKAKFRFNLEKALHDIEVFEDGHVIITAEDGTELPFESVEALGQEFAKSRNVPANILKNFEVYQEGSVYAYAQRSGTAGNDAYEAEDYGVADATHETDEEGVEEVEEEEIIDPSYETVKGAFEADVDIYAVIDDLKESFENHDNAVLFTEEGAAVIRERVARRIAVAKLSGGHVDIFKYVAGEEPKFEVTENIEGIVLPVADIVIVADSEDVPSLRELVCGPVEDAKTAVTESPLFSRMFR